MVRIFLRDLGNAAADGAVRIARADDTAQSAVRRAGVAVRSGVRAARVRAGLHPRRHGAVSDVASGRRAAPPGDRDHLYLQRAAADGRRLRHLVGRHVGAGAADRVRTAAADAADRRRVPIGAGRIAAPRRAASAAVDRRRHRDHARGRPGRTARSTTRATARRRCSISGRRAGSCGRWRRASSRQQWAIAWLHMLWWLAIATRRRGRAVADAQLARRRLGACSHS